MARAFMGVGRVGIAASLLFSISNVCFSTSVVYTDAANTLVIVASSTEGQFRFNSRTLLGAPTSHDGGRGPPSVPYLLSRSHSTMECMLTCTNMMTHNDIEGPLWAAMLSRVFLKEKLSVWTAVATLGAFAAVLMVFLTEILKPDLSIDSIKNATTSITTTTTAAAAAVATTNAAALPAAGEGEAGMIERNRNVVGMVLALVTAWVRVLTAVWSDTIQINGTHLCFAF